MTGLRLSVAVLATAFALSALPSAGAAAPSAGASDGPVASVSKKCKKKKRGKKRKCKKSSGTRALSADEQQLAGRGLWFEFDYDNDGVCYLYNFTTIAPRGYLSGGRTPYYVNPFTNRCRLTEPFGPNAEFIWSASGRSLRIQFVSGFVESIFLGTYFPDDFQQIYRASTGSSGWWGCRSPNFPFPFSAGCG